VAYKKRWTRLLSSVPLAAATALAAAAALAVAGCTSGSAAGSASGAGIGTASATAVTTAEAASAYQRIVATVIEPGANINETAALAATTDVAHVEVSTSQVTARYFNLRSPGSAVMKLGTPVFYLPASGGYPQWFAAEASVSYDAHSLPAGATRTGAPGGIQWQNDDGHAVFLFTKAGAAAPWQLSSVSKLAPGTSLPALATDGSGHVPTVSLSDTALLSQPDFTGPLQAAVVDDGPGSAAAKVVAEGQLTTGIYDNERAGLLGLTAPHGDVLQWNLEGSSYQQFALRTADGGALVFYAMYLNTTVQTPESLNQSLPLNPGPKISVSQVLAPLLPAGQAAPRIKLEGQQLLSFAAVDPPASASTTAKIQVIAIGGDWSYASAS
jgi:hypothetical protein